MEFLFILIDFCLFSCKNIMSILVHIFNKMIVTQNVAIVYTFLSNCCSWLKADAGSFEVYPSAEIICVSSRVLAAGVI